MPIPLGRLRRAGVPISINTDDPAPLETTLEDEYALCQAAWRESPSKEARLVDADVKSRLIDALRRW